MLQRINLTRKVSEETSNSKKFLLKAARGNVFIQEFDENRFQVQLKTLQEYFTDLDCNACIRSVTDTLQNIKVQSHLSEVFKLTKLLLVLLATNATGERIFSLLKLFKSYLRLTMKQSRLNYLMILIAYKNQLDRLNLTKIALDFINKNYPQKHILGKFN